MGYFNNIIADSRVSVRTATPAAAAPADLPGIHPNSWPVDDTRSLQMDEPFIQRVVEAPAPTLSGVPTPARSTTIASETPVTPAGESATPATTTISQPVPKTNSTTATDTTGTSFIGDAESRQNQTTAAQGRAKEPMPFYQRTSGTAASVPAVQRQISTPDIAGAAPPASHMSAPPDRQATVRPAPVTQRSPNGGATAAEDTVRPAQEAQARGSQAVAPQTSAMPGFITSNVVEGESAAETTSATTVPSTPFTPPAQPRRAAQAHAAPVVVPSVPLSSAPALQHASQRAVPRAPQVRIGQVNVIIEAPAAPRPQSPVTQTGNLSSRLFLRSL